MVAAANHTIAILPPPPHGGPTAGDIHALELAFLDHASACWRGDRLSSVFADRLSTYWRPTLPPQPSRPPDAVSPHGGGGRGIHWRRCGENIVGAIPGIEGGYQIPATDIADLVRCAALPGSITQLNLIGAGA